MNRRYCLDDWPITQFHGPPGPKGEPAACTCNVTDLMSTFIMPKTIIGEKGEPGIPGTEGKQGQMGLTRYQVVITVSWKPERT
ncbi:Protein of unknown function [Cotesia congregata]|uniref:Uncharacterized protein n=1 Tax=Cotesia congregata TaxID=51543 RepID=A0A8J2HEX6_COTCN|nr:Protein of unknown function [Cotesia congregata]